MGKELLESLYTYALNRYHDEKFAIDFASRCFPRYYDDDTAKAIIQTKTLDKICSDYMKYYND